MKTQKELNKVLIGELAQCKKQLSQYKKDFEIEKNIKNGFYFFILNNGLFDKLEEFEPFTNYQATDYHFKTLKFLNLNLSENSN